MSGPTSTGKPADYITKYVRGVRLDPARTILIIIDMQYATACRTEGLGKKLMLQGREDLGKERFDRIDEVVMPNLQRLLGFFREHDLPVLYLANGSAHPDYADVVWHLRDLWVDIGNQAGSRIHEIRDELKPRPGDLVLRKTTVSGFTSTGVEATLRALERDCLLFAGVSTNLCVGLTAMDAADRGFKCVLVDDCCGATTQFMHDWTLATFTRGLGRVARTDELIAELTDALRQ